MFAIRNAATTLFRITKVFFPAISHANRKYHLPFSQPSLSLARFFIGATFASISPHMSTEFIASWMMDYRSEPDLQTDLTVVSGVCLIPCTKNAQLGLEKLTFE